MCWNRNPGRLRLVVELLLVQKIALRARCTCSAIPRAHSARGAVVQVLDLRLHFADHSGICILNRIGVSLDVQIVLDTFRNPIKAGKKRCSAGA